MNHRPFEDWLLENNSLTSAQTKDLNKHLKGCTYCSALVSVEQVLKSPIMATPSAGFSERFKLKMIAEKELRQKRILWGFGLVGFLSITLIAFLGYQFLTNWVVSPSEIFVNLVTWIAGFSASVRTFGSIGLALINIAIGFIPLPLWISIAFGSFLLVLLWIFSLWKLSYSMQVRRLT